MRFLDPVQPSAIPALLFLIFLPLWFFVQRHHARLFFTVLSIFAILLVARPLVGGGLIAVIALAYFPIEWAAKRNSDRRLALFIGWLILHAALLACFHLPLPRPFTHLRPEDGPAVYVLFSGIGLTFLRLVSHLYDRLTGRTRPMSFADYLCYMVYFPQFRHGPLERGHRFVRRLTEARANWRSSDVVTGLARCALGLATVLAVPFAAWKLPDWFGTLDRLSARTLFLQPGGYSTVQIIAIIHAIPVVIYAFESGFASIQLGVSRAFGVRGSDLAARLRLRPARRRPASQGRQHHPGVRLLRLAPRIPTARRRLGALYRLHGGSLRLAGREVARTPTRQHAHSPKFPR